MQESHKPPSFPQDAVFASQLIMLVIRMIAYPMELITRRWGTMGCRYPNPIVAMIGVFLVPVVATMLMPPPYGGQWMFLSIVLLCLLSFCHNVRRAFRREHIHGEYVGDPWWGSSTRRSSEIVIGLIVSFAALFLCLTLGTMLLLSLFCSMINLQLIEVRERRILDKMRDAQIDAEYYATRLREGR